MNDNVKREYKQYIPIENLVTSQISRVLEYRSKRMDVYFMESVEALIDLLSPEDEEKALRFKEENNIYFENSSLGKKKYIDLLRFIKKLLADQNIIWKQSRGYNVGHDGKFDFNKE